MLNYIGPGMDGGVLSVVFGILLSFFMAIFAIVWYPFKRFLKKFKKKTVSQQEDEKVA
ncbi:MAG: hypothetical protein EKK39_06630 [Sphingobacteriales bacterium]|uniref:hypothetical protein n=1 Tax=Hydrotalea flava TaxID=714549 RepID=UPI000F9C38C2|nr:hypothetical protein [Hydrotalea flava]RTL52644.1 MAG: hypothetical protein EKK39_06630 [Sphingobacteriales bacterium]